MRKFLGKILAIFLTKYEGVSKRQWAVLRLSNRLVNRGFRIFILVDRRKGRGRNSGHSLDGE